MGPWPPSLPPSPYLVAFPPIRPLNPSYISHVLGTNSEAEISHICRSIQSDILCSSPALVCVLMVVGQSWEFWGFFFGMTTQAPVYRRATNSWLPAWLYVMKKKPGHPQEPIPLGCSKKGERTSWNMWAIFPALFCFSRECDKPWRPGCWVKFTYLWIL